MNRVLIVDDKPDNLYMLRTLLQGYGYVVEEAKHGAEALVKARQAPPAFVISDLLMPVMDGYTFLKHWKAEETLRSIPFIVYTATYTDPKDERLALELGADAFILKPTEPEPFIARIRETLARKDRGELQPAQQSSTEEKGLLTEYCDVVVRKLEDKILQVEHANGALQAEIADRQRAEAALRSSEERYRTLIAATSAIVWNTPASGEFAVEQPGWTAFTGQPFDLLRGWGWLNAVHPDEQESSARAWKKVCAGRTPFQGEHRIRRYDGEYRQLSVRAFPILEPDGTVREWVGAHTDVTDQKQAQADLLLRERAIRAATQGLLITDPSQPDNVIVYVSPGFERITGYRADEALGRNCRFLQGKDTDRTAVEQLRAALRTGQPCTIELLNYRKDGSTFWNELSISPVRDAADKLTHWVGVQTDVTARRHLEDQFRQVQKMEAVGQLAGGVAHDFNNLLTIINGYSDMLLHTLPEGDANRELITEIHRAGERSAGLTRQLLAFSRQQVLAPRTLDLNAVVVDTDKMLRRLIGEDVQLASTLDPSLGAVRADPGQVEQVLMNLAVNARDAMPRGGHLTIETRNVELDEGYARHQPDAQAGAHVLLAMTDTGSGIPPEVLARVFEPFYTTKGPGKGTGLGLSTVYGIIKQSGGHVTVYSELGIGTTFRIYLPRVDKVVDGSRARFELPTIPTGTETVLLVEDDDGVRSLTRHMLTNFGYTVLAAANGDEAERVASTHNGPIHLLITDVVMPGAGGRIVAERLAARHPGVRVLFVSGYTDDAVVRHGILEEKIHFLPKPFSPNALGAKIREVLDADHPDRSQQPNQVGAKI